MDVHDAFTGSELLIVRECPNDLVNKFCTNPAMHGAVHEVLHQANAYKCEQWQIYCLLLPETINKM